jgi:acyl-CoA dehydrogenase
MTTYSAPLKDVFFSLYDVNNYDEHHKKYELTKDVVVAIVEQAAKFAERELFPLNASGDAEGARFMVLSHKSKAVSYLLELEF